MSSSTPENGTFFIDPAQPAVSPVSPDLSAVPDPVVEPVELATQPVAPAPAPEAAPTATLPAPTAPASAFTDDGSTPMRDVPLGTLIFRAGLLAEEQLEDALQEGMRSGKRLGEVLLERGWLHERDLGRLLAGQKGLPFVEVRASDAEVSALQMLPEEKARMQSALPLRHEDGQLVVAVADPSNELVLENLRRSLGSEPRLVVALQSELIRAIGEAYAGIAPQATAPLEPAPQPEPSLPPAAALEPEATLPSPPPPPQEEPAPPAVVTQLPTVLPTEETHAMQPADATPLQSPLVIEHVAHVAQPAAFEPVAEPTPALPVEQPAPPVEQPALQAETAPLLEQPVPQPEPTVAPEPITPLAPLPVEAEPAPLEPLMPVAAPQPPIEPVESQSAPLLVPPAAQQPLETPSAPLGEAVAPLPAEAPVETPPASVEAQPGLAEIHIVLLRLLDGETLEVGTFNSAAEASARAQEVVRQIATAESEAGWPFFADRFIRPDTIASVDLLQETAEKWLGSSARSAWANNKSS